VVIGIHIATLVRCALAEVCTVSVLLVCIYVLLCYAYSVCKGCSCDLCWSSWLFQSFM